MSGRPRGAFVRAHKALVVRDALREALVNPARAAGEIKESLQVLDSALEEAERTFIDPFVVSDPGGGFFVATGDDGLGRRIARCETEADAEYVADAIAAYAVVRPVPEVQR